MIKSRTCDKDFAKAQSKVGYSAFFGHWKNILPTTSSVENVNSCLTLRAPIAKAGPVDDGYLKNNKTDSVRINVILRRLHATIVAVENSKHYLFILSVCL